ncbi:delta-like protein B [Ruditapes philippinarum]|uniref:delta-like protein B n=1 Tax=Ruditapes philippinarum TaxID=129788 RepID=UPI00295B5F7E|nr:delta-like protein B [Ruditapes philippinarum]XP_060552450.1 delta-like protein B [Ruditapes philippinarum]XP_060552452.1 delta-like protein B [Ruditapes philippinarum]XP_060552453.1 delta-like protein B [Ruditapes philippinarum]XP_060552454.1 delta-like protein B [Ruditapes philippinarum]XP_060552455.1 delta-like protein B [Ruditapes philippinarum]
MKLRKAATLIILGILHILILLPKVLCSGVFELRLSSFTNVRGLDYKGNCCNGVYENSNMGHSGAMCTEPCHTFFTICITNYMVDIPPDLSKEKCLLGYVMTNVLGGNNVNFETLEGFNNVFLFHFNISWPGTFSIIIQAWHDVTLRSPETGSPRERISRLAVQRELRVGPEWSNFIHKTNQTELEYKYRVQCSSDYYDAGCSTLCRPRDDHFGHYTCADDGSKVCMAGWKGAYCDQAICLEGCEDQHGYCDRPYECKCRSGWEGPLCSKCIKYPGCSNGNCSKPWECKCFEGWGGLFCTLDLNYCTHHTPCQNGGVCQNSGSGGYDCTCPKGYSGTNCEREIDDCLNQPCLNGGSCEDIGSGYSCTCKIGFTGSRCDVAAESCEKNPCKNGATCIEGQGSYVCQCKTGFTGRNCDQEIYECEPNPCQNNGRCIDKVNGFQCVCESGFSGKYCETNVDDCTHKPCKNNGVCLDKINDFECRCVPGFVGDFCQTNVDDCKLRPCANGGSCKDLVNNFTCTCRPGFFGRFCEVDIDECASNPCRNGATCKQSVDNYHCSCLPGFTGKNCQYLPGQIETTTRESTDGIVLQTTTLKENGARTVKNNVTVTEQHGQEQEFTTTQLLLIVCLGVGIPLLSIIIVVTILLCRKRRSPPLKSREEEENVQNSINNKLRESKIFTTIPQSSSNISNLTSKISNEDIDFNTLKSYRSSRPNSIYIGDKPINNKQLFFNPDLKVHAKHRDYEKTSKSLEKEKVSIDPSNLDVRDYRGSHDIHYIDKHINRDTINRNSLLILEPQLHQEPHRHSSYYGDDVLATEV